VFGLPSTTEVSQRLPKEAFYQHLKLDAKTRQQFVSGVERITVVNVVRQGTANIADGARVHEIMVLEVVPKKEGVPEGVLLAITKANPNPMVLVDAGSGRVSARTKERFVSTEGLEVLKLQGSNLDVAWDSIVSQIAFQEESGEKIEERLARKARIEALEHEIEMLDRKCRKEKQIARKNELFAQLKEKKAELLDLRDNV
jgi:hypothetical protein